MTHMAHQVSVLPRKMPLHTLGLIVRDKPGVLVRVALVFSRRGYNIESLVVSPANLTGEARERADHDLDKYDGFSRMTITCTGDGETLDQIIKQLNKLIDVVSAYDHTDTSALECEAALVKVRCPLNQRTEILQIAEHYNAKVLDYQKDSLIFRVAGSSDKLDYFIELLTQYELVEFVRSGKLVMSRGFNTGMLS